MAKGQKRSSRELRKPKSNLPKKTNASKPSLKGAVPAMTNNPSGARQG